MASSGSDPLRARWRAIEGTREPYVVAIFRVAFFAGLALHFFPALLSLDDAYARGSLRTEEWNHWLYVNFWRIPRGALRAGAVVTMLATVAAMLGLRPRASALVAGAGLYAFASFNGLHVHTLALLTAWALLMLWAICGGGSAVWSIDARLAPREPCEPRLFATLALYQVLLAVFFAGVEKILAGWPGTNEMGVLFAYPKGFLVRDWVAASPWMHGAGVTRAMSIFTLLVELGAPPLLLVKRTRLAALAAYELFFLGIVATLEVPPLFWAMFAFGALLALDDDDVARASALLRRFLRRG